MSDMRLSFRSAGQNRIAVASGPPNTTTCLDEDPTLPRFGSDPLAEKLKRIGHCKDADDRRIKQNVENCFVLDVPLRDVSSRTRAASQAVC